MKVTQEQLPDSQVGLEIEIPAEVSKQTYEKVLQKLIKTVRIPGFRPGKVPRQVFLQRFGTAQIKATALEELVQTAVEQAIKQESIEAIGNYQLTSEFEELIQQYSPGEVLTFQASVDVPPRVTLAQYTGLSVQAEEIKYDDSQVDEVLEQYRLNLATLVPIEDRRRDNVGILPGQRHNQIRRGLRQAVAQDVILGAEHLGHTGDGRGRIGGGFGRRAGAKHGHIAQLRGGGHRLGGGIHRQFAGVNLGQKKNSHYSTPASSLSFVISSSTEPTLTPAARASGSEVFTTDRRGVTSTP